MNTKLYFKPCGAGTYSEEDAYIQWIKLAEKLRVLDWEMVEYCAEGLMTATFKHHGRSFILPAHTAVMLAHHMNCYLGSPTINFNT